MYIHGTGMRISGFTSMAGFLSIRSSFACVNNLEKPPPASQFPCMRLPLPISRVINLVTPESQRLWAVDESEARRRLLASDVGEVLALDGSFALVAQDGERVLLA